MFEEPAQFLDAGDKATDDSPYILVVLVHGGHASQTIQDDLVDLPQAFEQTHQWAFIYILHVLFDALV